ncbi:hypothetical protein DLAC_08484 [Tieghemostelium lacteum]|uniref:Gamma-glutamyltransferase n=1 Tax=Tieghemostelium lacteum TaxID=361077 RepID=A0A151Z7K7_TIELA|nr:hypothetical protein DLAC_08484 [Tieghemostelium lacteum]|eukprot:KYQ89917.1 hypothetical protein DLAC_08484 [Tieghemostelium lacteum]
MNIITDKYSNASVKFATNGICASSQYLASQVGIDILKKGGNAADASVAMAAILNLTQPCSTGIGGDCFVLYYCNKKKKVFGLNGSGRSPQSLDIELCKERGFTESIPFSSALSVTVPGAAAAWVDTIERFGSGSLKLKDLLQPAIEYAENGVCIQPMTSHWWNLRSDQLEVSKNKGELLNSDGNPPGPGEVFKNVNLANTFRLLGENGKDGFYKGFVAEAIVEVLKELGGVMTMDDLARHYSTFDEPISINYRGYDIVELPPNGQGITALLALNILEGFDIGSMDPKSPEYIHLIIESLRLGFSDSRKYVSDPIFRDIPLQKLLSKEYGKSRRKIINLEKSNESIQHGYPDQESNTVYLSVVDKDGNACSFINSNYKSFGTGIIPKGCGFTLQNRGCNFSLDPTHFNSLERNKRPYHTIIPSMILKNGELYASFGIMGEYMQPQAHVQVVCNLIDHKMDPQTAIDWPRVLIENVDECVKHHTKGNIALEEGFSQDTIDKLIHNYQHHNIRISPLKSHQRMVFGNGQIILKLTSSSNNTKMVLCAGSDSRCDGTASIY